MLAVTITFAYLLVSLLNGVVASPIVESQGAVELAEREISTRRYDDLVFYFKYASSAYKPFNDCTRPNGNTRVTGIWDPVTDTQGYIARDDTKKEIVVSFRGSTTPIDAITDSDVRQVPFNSPGVSAPGDVRVHSGFLNSWNSVAPGVIDTVRTQLAGYPGYAIVTTGHSLGGSLASLAAISLQSNFRNMPIRMYTYGQPRTGNPPYASWINSVFGTENAFRVTHTTDPVVHLPGQEAGYAHHGVEYYIRRDPATAFNIDSCNPSGEDISCSNSVPFPVAVALFPAHLYYMGIFVLTFFCV